MKIELTDVDDGRSMIGIKIMVVECTNLCNKENILNSSNLIFKLEWWKVEVESTRKVMRLKSRDNFGLFYLEIRDER